MSTNADVRRYYDANHRTFLRFGTGRRAGVIHRAVWGHGVETRLQALHFVHEIVLAELEELGGAETARVLDLGCGAGASLRYLIGRGVGGGVGISNSPAQIAAAGRTTHPSLHFHLGDLADPDFLDTLPYPADAFDLVLAIESFAHISSPESFFRAATRFLRPGGRLVLIDDLRVESNQEKIRGQGI